MDNTENKKTAEEGKNVKNKKENADNKTTNQSNNKTKTTERSDVNSDVEQEQIFTCNASSLL